MSKSGNDLSKLIDGVMQSGDAVMRHTLQFTLGGGPLNFALKARVLEILNNDPVPRIDFELAGKKVDKKTFGSVCDAILRGRVNVSALQKNDPSLADLDANLIQQLSALYRPNWDTIFVKLPAKKKSGGQSAGDAAVIAGIQSNDLKGSIVHESIHAAHDIAGDPLTILETEAVAYVGEACYVRRKYPQSQGRPYEFQATGADGTAMDAVLYAAWTLAKRIVDNKDTKIPADDPDLKSLHDALKGTLAYGSTWPNDAGFNGV
jgi:hypothetical protein